MRVENIPANESCGALLSPGRVANSTRYLVRTYIHFEGIHTMTDTPISSSEPQKPASPAPNPQQNQGTPQPSNDKPGQQQQK